MAMSLPMNVVVILAVALIVLLGAGSFFIGVFQPTSSSMTFRSQFSSACLTYANLGCSGSFLNCEAAKGFLGIKDCSSADNVKTINSACGCIGGSQANLQQQNQQKCSKPTEEYYCDKKNKCISNMEPCIK